MQRLPRVFRQNFVVLRRLSTALQQQNADSEYSDVAEYPPIVENSYRAGTIRSKQVWRDKIKQIGTIEEKLIEINMPKYYGYKSVMLEKDFPYNTLPFFKYVTNTELVEVENFISKSEDEAKKIENFLNLIKSDIHDAFEFELDDYKRKFDIKTSDLSSHEKIRAKTSGVVKQINRVLINALGADHRHLYESDTDVDPRHEAFWIVGGIDPTDKIRKIRKGLAHLKRFENDPVDRPFQYVSTPLLAMRNQYPLEPFEDKDFDSMTAANENIPIVTYDPRTLGFTTDHRHATTIPGFWPGNVREYGLISYHERQHEKFQKVCSFGEEEKQEAIHSQGIISSYGWLLGQACYHGFSTYNDMTYPLATQTVITDGQWWSFYKYQLNTTCIHTSLDGSNFRYNKCWGTKEMKLFEQIDEKGKLQGLNEDVLKNLVQFYVNQPKARDYNMKPYLGAKEKKIADLENLEQRAWLEKTFKHVMSNRPRHRSIPEIYPWEKIYKIDNKTRQLARKLRFFELNINPFKRRLNEHQPEYIPRHLRARGIHDKKIWRPTYYPLDHRMNIPKEMSHSMFGAPRDPHACLMDRRRKSYK